VPSLWDATLAFSEEIFKPLTHLSLFRTTNNTYNMCHYWSNFEIADLDFYRPAGYIAYFDYLDRRGGFFCVSLHIDAMHCPSASCKIELTIV
jgi:alpha 1,2-mannosyltransferase